MPFTRPDGAELLLRFAFKENHEMNELTARRNFLQLAGVGAAAISVMGPGGCLAQGQSENKEPKKYQLKLGLASYTLRKFNLEQTVTMCKRVGLEYIAVKSFHIPLEASKEEIAKAAATIRDAGLKLYGGGVIYMKNPAEVNQAFNYAKAAGMQMIIGAPTPDMLAMTEQKVKEYDIKLAIHNHGPGDERYPTPESAYEKIKDMDKRMGLCIDIGHTQRYGLDPAEQIKKYGDRLLDVHLKDVSAAAAEGTTVEAGRGVIDLPKVLRALKEIEYSDVAAFEHEKDENDPLAGLAESVGYVRGALAVI
jgi:sugar phosphate isomerase/epimerase